MIYQGDIKPLLKMVDHVMVDKELSNNAIAETMGKSKQTISNLLNGRQPNVTLETLLALCQAIGCQLMIDIVPIDTETDQE